MRLFTPLRTAFASVLLAATGAALAQQPASTGTGLPMWVIRDADSTIYLTGTVHLLPDNVVWRSPKLEGAIQQSNELYLELEGIQDPDALRAKAQPIIMKYAKSDGPTLSSLLTADENAKLAAALKKAGFTDEAVARMDGMKPWYAAQAISSSSFRDAGFQTENGVDVVLGKMATGFGHPVRGMEEIEDQARVMAEGTQEAQLKQLRSLLSAPPGAMEAAQKVTEMAFRSWAGGDTHMVEAMIVLGTFSNSVSGMSTDALLKNRNEHWAAEIEDMLKGSGVAVIAVGAGHLVGPDSLQTRLALRGIKAERY